MNRSVIHAHLSETGNVCGGYRGWVAGDLIGISEESPLPCADIQRAHVCFVEACHKPVLAFRGQARCAQEPTESRSVMGDSVPTLVQRRDADGDHLSLPARERSASMHELPVQLEVLSHDRRVYGMHLDNVI